jgi:hypothetical protein
MMTAITMAAIHTVRLVAKRLRDEDVGTWPLEFGGGLVIPSKLRRSRESDSQTSSVKRFITVWKTVVTVAPSTIKDAIYFE